VAHPFVTYGIALIVRPVGTLLFGCMADLRGRRAVFVILIMVGATAAVAFLPGLCGHPYPRSRHADHAPMIRGSVNVATMPDMRLWDFTRFG
jgi:MFS family permease